MSSQDGQQQRLHQRVSTLAWQQRQPQACESPQQAWLVCAQISSDIGHSPLNVGIVGLFVLELDRLSRFATLVLPAWWCKEILIVDLVGVHIVLLTVHIIHVHTLILTVTFWGIKIHIAKRGTALVVTVLFIFGWLCLLGL
ncbi:hypothetical protein HG531_008011 [Fusarium graminearum]|nr:hypothetical protein HG531_008011 [Fusarium graminearum]